MRGIVKRGNPQDAYQRDVKVEIFGHASANTGNLALRARAHQAFTGQHGAHPLAAIGTEIRVILNDFAAIVAVHNNLHPYEDTPDCGKKFPPSLRWMRLLVGAVGIPKMPSRRIRRRG